MSAAAIGAPVEYLDALRKHIRAHKDYYGGPCAYTKSWRLKIVSKTNRHTATNGTPWGWFEITPIGKTVGYWGENKNDLKGFDIEAWNKEAEEVSPDTANKAIEGGEAMTTRVHKTGKCTITSNDSKTAGKGKM